MIKLTRSLERILNPSRYTGLYYAQSSFISYFNRLMLNAIFYADGTPIYFSIESIQQSKCKFEEIYVVIKKWMDGRTL